jgi:hypothetical protein
MKTKSTFVDCNKEEDNEKSQFTLNDIAPRWSKRLEQKKMPFPLSLTWLKWYFELDSPSKCIVGEAYGYSASYEKRCKECDTLGWQFGHSFLMRSRSGLQRDVKVFVEHWNKKHNIETQRRSQSHRTAIENQRLLTQLIYK